jgi:hypothetical protein
MSTLHQFKSTYPHINYIFKNGKQAIFVNGVYRTDVQWEIDELMHEISLGHPHIAVDAEAPTIDSEMIDPMNALRAKIIAEFLAKEAKATDPNNDMGNTDPNAKLMPGNSRDISEAASGGSGVPLSQRLVNLTKANG